MSFLKNFLNSKKNITADYGNSRAGALLNAVSYLENSPVDFKKEFSAFALKNDNHYPISGKRFPTSQQCIYALSLILQPKSYLEIGTKYGYSLAAVILGSHSLVKAVSVDIDTPFDKIEKNIQSLGTTIKPQFIKSDSRDVHIDEPFELCYVDGDHSYAMALHDIKKFWKNVCPGGIMMIDDTIKEREDNSKPNVYAYEAAQQFLKDTTDVESFFLRYPSYSGFGIIVKK